ncbi:penicillin acylase family protein [Winogradskyella sp. UBA3174]|uniref:penicillin acylase family protein n=1 Tax=Winogradskyella sp. UBA3174 TaxID=1947785 RepID=UPI0025E8128D|nr:penicillin acylase family protein [Winogradskyella sp. UBA3174]|tara:strand:+ start:71887 stop:74298 length:2412 start_codon:yes stop_codon:yes gene_type:complete
MKYFKLILSFILTIGIFFLLNTKLGSIPPIGKFLNPYTGVWQNETDESITGEIAISGLKDKVTVHYDAELIPHVFAQNEVDLYKAQGYLTAKHRLWQMEFQTYAAAGRLSEILGDNTLDYDRQERRRGMGYGAEQAIIAMNKDPETASFVKAYADGVNAYIKQLSPEDYPVEYKLLDYKPEAWTPKKTALLLMYMTKMLAGGDEDIENTNAIRLFGKERFDLLFPDFFDIVDPIIPKETDWSFIDVPQTPNPNTEIVLDSIAEVMDKPNPDNGSNNWAVSGSKSYSGNAILANDPHLGLKLPAIWFVMQLSTPNHNTFGATIPGALGVISGFNEHISWGETNATRDVIDWYKVEFNDDGTKYKYDSSWKDVTYRVETISIKGKEAYTDSIRFTHHGPVVFDKNFKSDNEKFGYAMKWIGHLGGDNQKTFLELNKSKNYDDYVKAISHYTAPAQNFVFASTEGDIALWIQGLLPNKWEGQGKFIMDGSDPRNDWQSFIPQQFNAHTKNPERGFVSSANQHPVDENYPYYVYNDGYETYRNRVINDFFSAKDKFSIQDFKDLQNSNYNLKAAEIVPYMLETMDISTLTKEEKAIYDEMAAWQFNNDIDEVGPSIFRQWYGRVYNMVWDEFDVEDTALDTPFTYQTIYLLKNKGDDKFMDILETPEIETAKELFLLAFKKATEQLQKLKEEDGDYKWLTYKATYAGHLLQALPALSRFDIPIGGDGSTVNATSENHGPSWRMIVEMTSPPTALGIYPGGQSGNPGSKYYDNFIDDWAAGKYHSLNFLQSNTATNAIIGTQTLTPSN